MRRYDILDALRGVAAIMVVIYHLYECFPMETWLMGHGYLAVDFFFLLSGFVIGHAYDKRLQGTAEGRRAMTEWEFLKRRIVRLYPMLAIGVLLGLASFLWTGGVGWYGTKATTTAILLATCMGLLLIPSVPDATSDVRGYGEMYSLNGPHWTLFFEFIASVIYVRWLHRLSLRQLLCCLTLLAIAFAWFFLNDFVGYGNIGAGWTLEGLNLWGGLLRMAFPFCMGLTIKRLLERGKIPQFTAWQSTFAVTALLVILFLSLPNMGAYNCLYEVVCVTLVFPTIVWLAAADHSPSGKVQQATRFLGDISYPLYAVHYPSMYVFYRYIGFPDTWRTPAECALLMLLILLGNILLATLLTYLYDIPVRRWAARKYFAK
ncbi:MAG: acyltransferase [Bacteroidaceae bacterium]|nr:acyltransferase [Bacteroidaceae bacterium]